MALTLRVFIDQAHEVVTAALQTLFVRAFQSGECQQNKSLAVEHLGVQANASGAVQDFFGLSLVPVVEGQHAVVLQAADG